jgi:hypothetical protein
MGESRKLQNEHVTATLWQDKGTVQLLSTNSDPLNDGAMKCKTGKFNEEAEIPCPQAIINYTIYMGGVDISDQKREYYRVGRSSNVNSFILYDLNNRPPLTAHGNRQLTLRRNLVLQLIGKLRANVQAGKEVCPSALHPLNCFTLMSRYRVVLKCVLSVYK